jgi:hypothetical protein
MSDERLIADALGKAQDILKAYIQPGPRDPEKTINELLAVLDDEKLVAAQERAVWASKK